MKNLTMKELYVIAKEKGIKNVSSFRKADLISKIESVSSFSDEELTVKEVALPEVIESIPTAIQPEPSNIVTKVVNAITETTSKVVERIQKPFKFNFDHSRANKGDYLTKRVGEAYISLKVLNTDSKATTVTTRTGIKLKLMKKG